MGFSGRKILKAVTNKLGNSAYKRKYKKYPQMFFTLGSLLEKVGIDINNLDETVKEKLDTVVSYVCRYGDRFTKNCVCVQLYDDSVNIMKKAVNEGALVCITKEKIDGIPCIVSRNTERVYADLCSIVRDTADIKSTVIAGSIGKTTTKKMVEAVYRKGFNTLCDAGNDNILDSVGSICQHIPEKAQQYIAEFSEDTPGLLEEMSKIVKPEIAIITAIDKSHIEYYGSEEKIFDEFRSVTKYMRDDGVCIISLDMDGATELIKDKKVVYVSLVEETADFYASDINVTTEGLSFKITEKESGMIYDVKLINSFAVHNVTSALMAFAAGVVSGLDHKKIVEGLADYRATGIRQNVYRSGKTVVYADCYNAVAKSIRSAINAADKIPVNGKRIAVLGDVAEAGNFTESTHLEIVDIVNSSSFDMVFTCGKNLQKAMEKSTLRSDLFCFTFDNQKSMNKAIKKQVKNGDLVLFKASHVGNLEATIASVFPLSYLYQAAKYYIPRIVWHFKVILN